MKNNASVLYGFFLIFSDAITMIAAFISAYVLRVSLGTKPIVQPVPARTYFVILLALIPFWIIIFSLIGLYSRSVYEKRFNEMGRLFIGTFIGTLFIVGIAFFSNEPIFPAKLVPVYGFVLTFALLVITRNLMRKIRQLLFRYNVGISNVLLVGNTDSTRELIDWLSVPEVSGYRVVGIVGGRAKGSMRHYKSFDEAVKALGKNRIHSVMQTEMFLEPDKNDEILTYAQNNHIAYRFIPGNSELFVGNIDVELFQSSIPMIAVHQTALFGWGRIAKRLFDTTVAGILCLLLSPLLLLFALLNQIFTGGVFFRQERLTRYNNVFKVFKFQTLKEEYNGLTPEEGFKKMGREELIKKFRDNGDFLANDPRLTAFGRFMRRTSLDELPQLFNVLKGDISLVGPRALIPQELELYTGKHTILSVKSGMTGLAQVSGRKNISFEERRKLDLYYVQNWSFWLDLTILIKTFRVLINRDAQ